MNNFRDNLVGEFGHNAADLREIAERDRLIDEFVAKAPGVRGLCLAAQPRG